MPRITPDNPARRRLFAPDDATEEATVDNLANILQESIIRDRIEKSKKWNFDFENEKPLDGKYEWVKCETSDTNSWIGVKTDETIEAKDSVVPMQVQNEATPKSSDTKGVVRMTLKRRLRFVVNKDIRRRLVFP
ncbi:unnamed protein product [Leptidea sinapis]|uniref:Cyclin-dependent kinase inhibitor domain-containing protein n=1 Tax=Leptidea sinapis TaxID=189913 RepID=A0A5E4QNP4_9NEOP|nr:unnamed protein product [Leptidea sinapis]